MPVFPIDGVSIFKIIKYKTKRSSIATCPHFSATSPYVDKFITSCQNALANTHNSTLTNTSTLIEGLKRRKGTILVKRNETRGAGLDAASDDVFKIGGFVVIIVFSFVTEF